MPWVLGGGTRAGCAAGQGRAEGPSLCHSSAARQSCDHSLDGLREVDDASLRQGKDRDCCSLQATQRCSETAADCTRHGKDRIGDAAYCTGQGNNRFGAAADCKRQGKDRIGASADCKRQGKDRSAAGCMLQ